LPEFFIKFLTEPNDLVLDPFAGSNITGEVAERLGRRWLAFELVEEYLEASKFRFPEVYKQFSLFGLLEGRHREPVTADHDGQDHDKQKAQEVDVKDRASQPLLIESKAEYHCETDEAVDQDPLAP
jgi:hypothetical protein